MEGGKREKGEEKEERTITQGKTGDQILLELCD